MSPPHNHHARSRSMLVSLFPIAIVLYSSFAVVQSQQISTNTPVPPLQWIQLTNLIGGNPPASLKDASIGYDEVSRKLVIFGGEPSPGNAVSATYT